MNAVSAVSTSHIWAVGSAGVIYEYVACALGSLSLAAPSTMTLPSATLTGGNSSVSTTSVLTPDDETGSLLGWDITATSTTFTNGGGKSLPTTAATITGATSAAATDNCSLPTNSVSYPLTVPAGGTPPTAVKVFNAAAASGAWRSQCHAQRHAERARVRVLRHL